ncbi:hypothetical protein M9Y10_005101 [Tritrichomonas musculus]|uniref:DUF4201 domain-containing protein n=1 Tax=Tritrichomonas musculus TaxID=1915356 RepID=A0ABR2JKJ2_9EUKA
MMNYLHEFNFIDDNQILNSDSKNNYNNNNFGKYFHKNMLKSNRNINRNNHNCIKKKLLIKRSKDNLFLTNLSKTINELIGKEEKLRDSINLLHIKEDDFINREFRARQILSEQIDDLRAEEILVSELEQSNLSLPHSKDQINIDNSIDSLANSEKEKNLSLIITMEKDNKKRKEQLNLYKQRIESIKQSFGKFRSALVLKSNIPKPSSESENKNQINLILESNKRKSEFEGQFHERKEKLESIQKEISEMEDKVTKKRKQLELEFNKKISKIESLAKELLHVKSDIKYLKSQNQQIRIKLTSLHQEKGSLNRQVENTLRGIKLTTYKNSSIEKRLQLIEKKKRNIAEKEKELNIRRLKLNKFRSTVSDQVDQLNSFEEKVQNLESQVIELENQNSIVFNQMKIAQEEKSSIIQMHHSASSIK